ncbi:MFS general substrate transporter [Panus rudis PR-1116 ss-1]|nr:MFS general substrate transporter [Panus rudis PR-1116 ss-1]
MAGSSSTEKERVEYVEEKNSLDNVETGVKEAEVEPATSWAGTPEEKRLVRKLDWRIMPMACILYLFAYLDRTNLGNARLQDLPQDTLGGDPTGVLFDWVNSAFFFSYILCQVPATVTSKLFPPRIWIGCAAVGWGLSSTLMAAGFNFPGLIVARVFLGIFEACFGPGIPLYLSFWYTKHEMGVRMAYWFGFAAVAGAFGGLIAFGVQHAHTAISNWRLLFIIEGVPTVLLGLLAMIVLPDRPEETPFLNEEERKIQLERRSRGLQADFGRVVNKSHVYSAFRDWRIYTAGVIYFGANCALASNSAFLPTIIKTFGVSNASAQLLTVPPYAVSAVVLTLTSYLSDKIQNRGIPLSLSACVSGIGYLLLLTVPNNNRVRYFATFCITSGTYTVIGIIIAWSAHNLGSETKKATGIPMYMAIGQCGSVLGSHLFPAEEGPRYIKGFAVACALAFLAAICGVILSVSYKMENKRRDRKHGVPNPDAAVDTTELADKAPMFRYVP